MAFFVGIFSVDVHASGIKVVPSSTRIEPGETFYVDINVEDIPAEGLGAIQFRLDVTAQGSDVVGTYDITHAGQNVVAVSTPLIIEPSVVNRSGIGDFFWIARGDHGVLVMDNEELTNGSALYTFGHTNGASPPSGSGSVARFYFAAGSDVQAERIDISLSDVMLLDGGSVYPLDSNVGATVELRCSVNMPDLIGLSLDDAQAIIQSIGLVLGGVYELDNHTGNYPLGEVLEQSFTPGAEVQCESPLNVAVNIAPSDVTGLNYADKTSDESGTVVLNWTVSNSSDVAGYRVYVGSETSPAQEIDLAGATTTEVSGLPNGQASQLRVAAFDAHGNESVGAQVFVEPVDDVAPRILISGVEEGAYYTHEVELSASVDDVSGVSVGQLLNGSPYEGAAIAVDGSYEYRVTVIDEWGNSTTEEVHFFIDMTPPIITIAGVENGIYYNTDLHPDVLVEDAYPLETEILLNSEPFDGTSVTEEGPYELSVRAEDRAGNVSEITYVFYIDKTRPISEISIGSPSHEEGGDLFITESTTFILTGSDAGAITSGIARLEYRVNNQAWEEYTQPFSLSGRVDGSLSLEYRAQDAGGNVEEAQKVALILDNAAPVTTVSLNEPSFVGEDGTIFITKITYIELSSEDMLSGVESIEYRLDDGEWVAYAPFTVSGEGLHSIEYRAVDNLGLEEDAKVLEAVVDDTPPVTSIEIGNPNYQGEEDLYVTSATMFTLSAVDNASGAGYMEYRIDDGAWTPYEAFSIGDEGNHAVSFRSIDNLGNEEAEHLLAVVVDNTAPETSIEAGTPDYEDSDGNLYVTESTIFTLTSSDTLSGVASTEYRIDEGEWLEYAPFMILSEGSHTIWYRSTDNVKNGEAAKALEVIMDNTPPESTITVGQPMYQGNALYVTSATVFTIGAEDADSGVKGIEYRLNGGEWVEYGPFTLPNEGVHSIEYRAVDNLGLEEDAKFLEVVVDNSPPATSIEVGSPRYQGEEDLYVTKSTVFTLIAVDNASGVGNIEYRMDGGAWTPYEAFAIAAEGEHVIGFRSIDNLDQTEAEKTLEVVVDNTPPVTSVSFGEQSYQDGSEVLISSSTLIALNAVDNLSGVEGTYYQLDGETGWQTYDAPFSLSGLAYGSHVLSYYSVDNVENTGKENTVTIVHIGIDAGTTILNIPRVLVWTEDSIHTDRVKEFIEASFAGKDVYFRIVTGREDFIEGFRSGIYNIVAIMDTKTPLDANTMREIREAVNNGMGLLVSAWSNNVHPIIADILGVKFRGSRPMDIDARAMDLHESSVSEAGGLTIYSRVLKAEPDGGETVAEVPGDPGKGGNPSRPVPALVLNVYGGGRTVFAAFDIAGSASYANPAEFAALFRNCVDYVLPEEPNVGAGSTILLETSITMHGTGLDIKAADSLAEGLTYVPLFDLAYQNLVFGAYVEDGETVSYRYFVRLPNERGQYAKTTEVSILVNGEYQLFDTYGFALEVADDSESLLATSRDLLADAAVLYPEEAGRINAVISQLDVLSAMALGSRAETGDAIRITVGAIEKILAFGFDTKELRGLLDEYLRIIEAHYTTVEDAVEVLNASSANEADIVVNIVGDGAGAGAISETGGSPEVELEKEVPDYPRVLVWLNDGCGSVPSGNNCVRRDLIAAAMEGIVYRITENAEEFWRELRSGFYTDYIILGDAEALDEGAEWELSERVFSGRGLVSSHWTGSLPGELFGMSAVGEAAWHDSTVEFAQSDVFAAMGMQSRGTLLSIEAIEPANAVAHAEGGVAVLKGAYGFGNTLYFAYDLGLSLTDANVAQVRTVLWDSVAYVHADGGSSESYPYMVRPVRVSVTSPIPADVVLREHYPEGVRLIDGETGVASTHNPEEFPIHLNAGQAEHVEYYALLPDVMGTYSLVSEAGNASASVEFVIARTSSEMADGIVSLLDGLRITGRERQKVQNARRLLSEVRNRTVQGTADIQLNISDVLAASGEISALNADGMDVIRLEMDRLLGVWQQRWFLEEISKN